MAAVSSAWAKPGAWALDAEEHEAELLQDADKATPAADFPSLAAAAAAPTSKKKKSQRLSLAEFNSATSKTHFSSAPLVLPTGPRERSAEELDRSSSRGFGYSSYGGGRDRDRDDPNASGSRWGSSRASDEPRRSGFGGPSAGSDRDSGPSRADEIDDWGAAKKSFAPPPPSERRERGGGFFDSQSRADESDSWVSKKSAPAAAPPSNGRRLGIGGGGFDGPRERRGGFDMFNKEGSDGAGRDSDTWGRKREEANGTAPDSDEWRKKREESSSGGRPRLVLQPRSMPLTNGNVGEQSRGEPQQQQQQQVSAGKSKGSNPFGEARPREEVLAEKGQDWKEIDEKLESVKIREAPPEGPTFGRKGFGVANGNGSVLEDRTHGSWRKEDAAEAPPARSGL